MTAGVRGPDPQGARTPGEFLALLGELKDRSGLTYRELSARAAAVGEVLPRSTVANMLARVAGLPREELLTAFVRACGVPPGERDAWLRVRKELAAGGVREVRASGAPGEGRPHGPADAGARRVGGPDADAPDADGADADAPDADGAVGDGLVGAGPDGDGPDVARPGGGLPASAEPSASDRADLPASGEPPLPDRPTSPALAPDRSRIPRLLVGGVAVAGLVLAVVSVVTLVRDGVHRMVEQPVAPAAGPVLIRSMESGLCLGEKTGERSGQVHQRECAGADVPRYELLPLSGADSGRWRLVTDHPEFGPGCSGVPGSTVRAAAPLHDSECGEAGRTETFRLEPYGSPVQGYRIRPGDSALCVTVAGDLRAPWSRLETAACAEDARGRRGQLFSFDRRP
ncbi:helix-turn-helix transcriptional regulator [Streptomyces sp. HUAS MG47]|uniref:helix-turn-helix domain-containing protein n=1 Tax=Streptomyces solicamelliae TaxID=3231716 RepID=UPI00387805E5